MGIMTGGGQPGGWYRISGFSCLREGRDHGKIGRAAALKLQKIDTREINFDKIDSIEDLEMVSEEVIWQNFERLAAFIFEKNDFSVAVNTVKTYQKKRRQYDVIARRSNETFLIECKKWAGNRYRLSALKKAVEQHHERTMFYNTIMNEDAVPLVVTLVEEEIQLYAGVPLVPVLRLNAFIHELDKDVQGNSFRDFEDDLSFPDEMPTNPSEFSGTCE